MNSRAINEVLARLRRVQRSPRLRSDQHEALRRSIREFVQIRRSGKLDKGKLFRATARVAEILLDFSQEEE